MTACSASPDCACSDTLASTKLRAIAHHRSTAGIVNHAKQSRHYSGRLQRLHNSQQSFFIRRCGDYRKGYAIAREMLLEYEGKVQAQGAEIRATTGPASPFHQATWRSTAVNIIAREMLLGFRESPWG